MNATYVETQWIWQKSDWPNFSYDEKAVMPALERCIQIVAPLKRLGTVLTEQQRLDWEAAILLDETLSSAKIEGELFDRDSVRSSIVRKLGLGVGIKFDKHCDGAVELLLRSIRSTDRTITHDVLKSWHQLLFPEQPLVTPMTIGDYRDDEMQILSGRYGKQTIHYVAPGDTRQGVSDQMSQFLCWLNAPIEGSAYIRAAIAKFWFVTVHPFDDGNGRLSRVIAERCLAEAEKTNLRLFSLSTVLEQNRIEYYQQLEDHQSGSLDLTQWIIWFLNSVEQAAHNAEVEFERVMHRTRFWQAHQQTAFNPRQLKLLKRMLETPDFADGISRKKYKSLSKAADATAVRDLIDLVDKQVLVAQGEGRARRYLMVL
jgi:Fic family protein